MQKTTEKLSPPDLSKYGIKNVEKIYYNLSYDELFKHETDPSLEVYEKGFVTNLGAVAVDTGIFTGRSPKDKYIVKDNVTSDNIWWANKTNKGSDNNHIRKYLEPPFGYLPKTIKPEKIICHGCFLWR